MNSVYLNFNVIKLHAIESTNQFLADLLQIKPETNFTACIAQEQTNGRGQQGSHWFSKKGLSLTCSIAIKLNGLHVDNVFYLNMAFSTALCELLNNYISNCALKWPNDIFINDKKAGGLLITNNLHGKQVVSAIVGVGLNVKNNKFPAEIANNSTSLAKEGANLSVEDTFRLVLDALNTAYNLLKAQKFDQILQKYEQNLWRLNTSQWFFAKEMGRFRGKIIGVNRHGQLKMAVNNSSKRALIFDAKQIQYPIRLVQNAAE